MQRISMEDQEAVVGYLMEFYGHRLKTFGIDKTGLGFTLWERLARTHGEDRIKGYNFSAKYAVALEDREMKRGETAADLVIERNIVEFASDAMREIVDAKGFLLPFDRELLQEWQGQSYVLVKSTSNPYGKREFSAGKFHTLDAGKMLVAGMRLAALDGVLSARAERTPVLDVFMGA
jgi:hypothetical protein